MVAQVGPVPLVHCKALFEPEHDIIVISCALAVDPVALPFSVFRIIRAALTSIPASRDRSEHEWTLANSRIELMKLCFVNGDRPSGQQSGAIVDRGQRRPGNRKEGQAPDEQNPFYGSESNKRGLGTCPQRGPGAEPLAFATAPTPAPQLAHVRLRPPARAPGSSGPSW